MNDKALEQISKDPNYQVLKRLPETLEKRPPSSADRFSAVVIDLETMGLDAKKDAIIEIGLLKFSFTSTDGIIEVTDTYNSLSDPGLPIPELVTKITGITDTDVKDQKIDWGYVAEQIKNCNLVICHNSGFDRNFLELQTPVEIQALFKKTPFACTLKDIDWSERGFESSKLDYLNWKLGFFYDGHRALTDCWAAFNLLIQEDGAFDELKNNVKKSETLLCAVSAPFEKKDLLKERKYRWSDGAGQLPKCWWITVSNESIEEETSFLEEMIYGRPGAAKKLPQSKITAHTRYSFRAEVID